MRFVRSRQQKISQTMALCSLPDIHMSMGLFFMLLSLGLLGGVVAIVRNGLRKRVPKDFFKQRDALFTAAERSLSPEPLAWVPR